MPAPINIPWPLSSAPGVHPQESGGRLINVTAEPLGSESPVKIAWRRQPGLSSFADTTLSPFRGGGILVNNLVYLAVGGKVINVDSAGTVVQSGNLAGSPTKAFFARNNEATPKIQCVVPGEGAFSVTAGSVTAFTGGGVLPAPNSVCGQDGYFFWGIGDNRIFAAGPNSTTVNANTFVTVQSRPVGNLLRVLPYKGLLWAFASKFIEVYKNDANAFPAFPYNRLAVIDTGLFGRNAIAGWEDGFGALYWVGDDCGVYRVNGAEPEKVSPPDLDRLIQAVPEADVDTVEAFCYHVDGKSFWAVASDDWTWEFNLNTQKWHERDSYSAGLYGRWRASGSVNAFGKWLVGDTLSNNLLSIDPIVATELGSPMRRRMESALVTNFPNRQAVARADLNFITGIGVSASETEGGRSPKASIAISRNGGVNWDNPRIRELGTAAQGRRRVYVTSCGMFGAAGGRVRFDIADACNDSFVGGTVSPDPRAY